MGSNGRFEKGGRKGGRPVGAYNKSTIEIKQAFQALIESQLPRIRTWLERVAEKDPNAALDKLSKLAEYVIPKLARNEIQAQIEQKNSPLADEIKALRDAIKSKAG